MWYKSFMELLKKVYNKVYKEIGGKLSNNGGNQLRRKAYSNVVRIYSRECAKKELGEKVC